MKIRVVPALFLSAVMTLTVASVAWAHTTVSPEQAATDSTQTFTVSTPGEKSVPIVEERVEIPQGFEVTGVSSPDGWQGSVERNSVVWSDGEIPEGEEQEFSFEAQVPAQAGEYEWHAFDTYEDGSVSEWIGPKDSDSPASVTKVVAGGVQTTAAEDGGHHGDDLPETGGPPFEALAAGLVAAGLGGVLLKRRLS